MSRLTRDRAHKMVTRIFCGPLPDDPRFPVQAKTFCRDSCELPEEDAGVPSLDDMIPYHLFIHMGGGLKQAHISLGPIADI